MGLDGGHGAAPRRHPAQGRVAVPEMVLQGAGDVQEQADDQHALEHDVERRGRAVERVRGRHEGERLTQRPPDRGEPLGGRMGDPPRQRHQHERGVQEPVHGVGQRRLEAPLGVEMAGLRLRDGPGDPGQRHEEDRHAERLVDREQHGLAGDLLGRVVGQIVRDDAERDHHQDGRGDRPVERLGHDAVAIPGVAERGGARRAKGGHRPVLERRRRPESWTDGPPRSSRDARTAPARGRATRRGAGRIPRFAPQGRPG